MEERFLAPDLVPVVAEFGDARPPLEQPDGLDHGCLFKAPRVPADAWGEFEGEHRLRMRMPYGKPRDLFAGSQPSVNAT